MKTAESTLKTDNEYVVSFLLCLFAMDKTSPPPYEHSNPNIHYASCAGS